MKTNKKRILDSLNDSLRHGYATRSPIHTDTVADIIVLQPVFTECGQEDKMVRRVENGMSTVGFHKENYYGPDSTFVCKNEEAVWEALGGNYDYEIDDAMVYVQNDEKLVIFFVRDIDIPIEEMICPEE